MCVCCQWPAILICHLLQVVDFSDKVNSYVMNAVMFFKSMWPEVKSNAALFVGKYTQRVERRGEAGYTKRDNLLFEPAGFMLGNLPKEKAGLISKEHICEGTYT